VQIERRSARTSRLVKNATIPVAPSMTTVAFMGFSVFSLTIASYGGSKMCSSNVSEILVFPITTI